jgi:hypothetical protein
VSLHHESAGNVTMDFKEGGRTRDISKKDSDFLGEPFVQLIIEFLYSLDKLIST